MARKLYRCMTEECGKILVTFETQMGLDSHLALKHGVETEMIDVDTIAEGTWKRRISIRGST